MLLRIGSRVDGLYAGGDVWFPGFIVETGTLYTVKYDDGEVEENVPEHFLRVHELGTFCTGSRVLVRYGGGEEYYAGVITGIDEENQLYDISYDDGEVEENVAVHLIVDEIVAPVDSEAAEASMVDSSRSSRESLTDTTQDQIHTNPQSNPEDPPRQIINDEPPEVKSEEANALNIPKSTTPLDLEVPVEKKSLVQEATRLPQETEATAPVKLASEANISSQLVPEATEPPVTSLPRKPTPPPRPQRDCSDTLMQAADEPFSTFLSCENEVLAILCTLAEPVVNNDSLIVVKNALAQLLHQLRIAPHVTSDICKSCHGEKRLLQCIQDNMMHSIIVCFCFVIIRRLCSVSEVAFDTFLTLDVINTVANVMLLCPQDAVLQASACGVLATFARGSGIERMLTLHVPQLILSVLLQHQPLNHYSRQVHYYACEVLLKLADTGDKQLTQLMSSIDPTNNSTAMHLLVILLRQGHLHEDQKVACAACTLVLCLAAKDRKCAEILRSTDALSDISTVMAKYPNDNGISQYSTVATREIALASIKSGPSRVHDKAKAILTKHVPSAQSKTLTPSGSSKKLLKPPTPSKKQQAFSRNSIAPAPKLTSNLNDSLSKMQVLARSKPPFAPQRPQSTISQQIATPPSAVKRTKSSIPSPDRLIKHHSFIPFEHKLEWRLMTATTPKKTIPAPSPTARTLERENVLMKTYGVPSLKEMHIPPSTISVKPTQSSAREKASTKVEIHKPKTARQHPSVKKPRYELDIKPPPPTPKKKVKAITIKPQSLKKINHQDILNQRAMSTLATQLFQTPEVKGAKAAPVEEVKAEGRLSFSDKLHQMIRTAEEALCRPPSAKDLHQNVQFVQESLPPKKPLTPNSSVSTTAPPPPEAAEIPHLGLPSVSSEPSNLNEAQISLSSDRTIESDKLMPCDEITQRSNAESMESNEPLGIEHLEQEIEKDEQLSGRDAIDDQGQEEAPIENEVNSSETLATTTHAAQATEVQSEIEDGSYDDDDFERLEQEELEPQKDATENDDGSPNTQQELQQPVEIDTEESATNSCQVDEPLAVYENVDVIVSTRNFESDEPNTSSVDATQRTLTEAIEIVESIENSTPELTDTNIPQEKVQSLADDCGNTSSMDIIQCATPNENLVASPTSAQEENPSSIPQNDLFEQSSNMMTVDNATPTDTTYMKNGSSSEDDTSIAFSSAVESISDQNTTYTTLTDDDANAVNVPGSVSRDHDPTATSTDENQALSAQLLSDQTTASVVATDTLESEPTRADDSMVILIENFGSTIESPTTPPDNRITATSEASDVIISQEEKESEEDGLIAGNAAVELENDGETTHFMNDRSTHSSLTPQASEDNAEVNEEGNSLDIATCENTTATEAPTIVESQTVIEDSLQHNSNEICDAKDELEIEQISEDQLLPANDIEMVIDSGEEANAIASARLDDEETKVIAQGLEGNDLSECIGAMEAAPEGSIENANLVENENPDGAESQPQNALEPAESTISLQPEPIVDVDLIEDKVEASASVDSNEPAHDAPEGKCSEDIAEIEPAKALQSEVVDEPSPNLKSKPDTNESNAMDYLEGEAVPQPQSLQINGENDSINENAKEFQEDAIEKDEYEEEEWSEYTEQPAAESEQLEVIDPLSAAEDVKLQETLCGDQMESKEIVENDATSSIEILTPPPSEPVFNESQVEPKDEDETLSTMTQEMEPQGSEEPQSDETAITPPVDQEFDSISMVEPESGNDNMVVGEFTSTPDLQIPVKEATQGDADTPPLVNETPLAVLTPDQDAEIKIDTQNEYCSGEMVQPLEDPPVPIVDTTSLQSDTEPVDALFAALVNDVEHTSSTSTLGGEDITNLAESETDDDGHEIHTSDVQLPQESPRNIESSTEHSNLLENVSENPATENSESAVNVGALAENDASENIPKDDDMDIPKEDHIGAEIMVNQQNVVPETSADTVNELEQHQTVPSGESEDQTLGVTDEAEGTYEDDDFAEFSDDENKLVEEPNKVALDSEAKEVIHGTTDEQSQDGIVPDMQTTSNDTESKEVMTPLEPVEMAVETLPTGNTIEATSTDENATLICEKELEKEDAIAKPETRELLSDSVPMNCEADEAVSTTVDAAEEVNPTSTESPINEDDTTTTQETPSNVSNPLSTPASPREDESTPNIPLLNQGIIDNPQDTNLLDTTAALATPSSTSEDHSITQDSARSDNSTASYQDSIDPTIAVNDSNLPDSARVPRIEPPLPNTTEDYSTGSGRSNASKVEANLLGAAANGDVIAQSDFVNGEESSAAKLETTDDTEEPTNDDDIYADDDFEE